MENYASSIHDYDEALKVSPRSASAFYGRGLAKRAEGDAAGGTADVEAAQQIDPQIAQHFGIGLRR
jgi:hypothetical protein